MGTFYVIRQMAQRLSLKGQDAKVLGSFFSNCSDPPWKHDLWVVFLALGCSRLTVIVLAPVDLDSSVCKQEWILSTWCSVNTSVPCSARGSRSMDRYHILLLLYYLWTKVNLAG